MAGKLQGHPLHRNGGVRLRRGKLEQESGVMVGQFSRLSREKLVDWSVLSETLEPELAAPCLLVEEKTSSEVISAWKSSLDIATSAVAYAELLAAVYRKATEMRIKKTHSEDVVGLSQKDWSSFIIVGVDNRLNETSHRKF